MDGSILASLVLACAPQVHADTAIALVDVESARNPYAIGVVGGALFRQPINRAEAISTAKALQASGWNFSVGLAQINVRNFARLGLTLKSAFEPCRNLGAMQVVLTECFDRAHARSSSAGVTVRRALSCYYSGDFAVGFTDGYVRRVVMAVRSEGSRPEAAPALRNPTNRKEVT